ncbi:hypothetical protein MRB53_039051 [Persea americana]|nr:hypothetical protein MRB53_039051 [Persea americana]
MDRDVALATTLALVFSESFDHATVTGQDFIRWAKNLVLEVVCKATKTKRAGQDLRRLKFLYAVRPVPLHVLTGLVPKHGSTLTSLPGLHRWTTTNPMILPRLRISCTGPSKLRPR